MSRLAPLGRRAAGGFTLLEILIAVAIFVVVGALALGGYVELANQSERANESAARVTRVRATMVRMTQDFEALEPRPIREPLGTALEPALRSDARTTSLVEITRAGWSNPAGLQRSTLQRVAYRLEDGKLLRTYWNVLDRTLDSEPVEAELLDKVRGVTLRYMDLNRSWNDQWPPTGATPATRNCLRPIAIEITLDLEDWGALTRLVELPG